MLIKGLIKRVIVDYKTPSSTPELEEVDLVIKIIDNNKNILYVPGKFKDHRYYCHRDKNQYQALAMHQIIAWGYFPIFEMEH